MHIADLKKCSTIVMKLRAVSFKLKKQDENGGKETRKNLNLPKKLAKIRKILKNF